MKKSLPKRINKNNGFSLLELSITIVILSIISVALVTFYSYSSNKVKTIRTEEKLEKIEQAIANYFSNNGHLPCPARLNSTSTNIYFGKEAKNDTNNTCLLEGDLNTSGLFFNGTLVYGALPVYDLGLDANYAYDEWGNSISYVADTVFRDPAAFKDEAITESISLDSYGGISVNGIFVIISHGKNGFGAFNQGYQNPLPKNTGTGGNAERNNIVIQGSSPAFDEIFKIDLYEDDYDDIILFKTKFQLIVEAYW